MILLVKNLIFHLIGVLPRIILKKSPNFSRNILFVLLSKPLGDFVSRLEFLNSVELLNNGSNCYLVADQKFEVLGSLIPAKINKLFIDSNEYKINPFYRYKIFKILNSLKFEKAINLSVDRGMFNDEISLNCGAQNIITTQMNSVFLSRLFTNINNSRYTLIIDLVLMNEFDKIEELKVQLSNKFHLQFDEDKVFRRSEVVEEYIVVAPFASQKIQSWSIQNYLLLIKKLVYLKSVIILGDKQPCDYKIFNGLGSGVKNLLTKTSLKEANEIIKRAKLYIGNDSGLTHLAYLHKVPLIGIIGGGNFGQFFPHGGDATNKFFYHSLDCFNCNWKCKFSKPFCLTEVSVDMVYNSALKLLNK